MTDDVKYLRVQVRGQWRSICKDCFQTAALADSERELGDGERDHKCGVSRDPYAWVPRAS